jgi:hypothetical protein
MSLLCPAVQKSPKIAEGKQIRVILTKNVRESSEAEMEETLGQVSYIISDGSQVFKRLLSGMVFGIQI